ncbi:cytochrome c biogenesis protein DipZ [Pseudogulbenkiania ferrooxidans]|uniref:Alkyl hydroperoxide reductase/ Thiol specific antioxidant/ Mal allergen n=1 Tax=Pseudogulbenkiania ferrooxidans 2002 TaxID=279714 RepID=B9Z0B6_9NEIS|nr:cytochrome c biogenesis protein DipZ [Pseudogulbenkiania ferrooxidans]EEG09999.1 alkyl hydroperoxide reductase/ Thiol specific antioxidant/ Mal allergen [Pseudogulbenkiania ferrooxidans 2002]
MLLLMLSYLGGVLTIFSPCVLPVIPFVFARADQPFRRAGLPILLGMALTFAGVATLAAVGGSWVVAANQYGRIAALVLMALLGLTLLLPALAERVMRPLVRLGGQLQQQAEHQGSVKGALLLGVAIGFLWAPCAGPILGLVLAGAALNGPNAHTALLLLAFAAGAGTSLAGALFAGSRLFRLMKRGLGAEEWIRRGLGVAVLAGVTAIALGLDTQYLAKISYASTARTEQALINTLSARATPPVVPAPNAGVMPVAGTLKLADEGPAPALTGATRWLNSPPLSLAGLRGKVVLVDFWTYSCINCLRTLPYLKSWWDRYQGQGLVIIGVHAPEFAFERDEGNVRKAIRDLGIPYPVAMDNDFSIWNAYHNQYWPAHYLIDAQGRVRDHTFGEGDYAHTEAAIRQLLAEAHSKVSGPMARALPLPAQGVMAAGGGDVHVSPETYIGSERAEYFASPERFRPDRVALYSTPPAPALNQWGLAGRWKVGGESATLARPQGAIVYRFRGRDLHLVLGNPPGTPVRFRVTLDGAAPGADHGADVGADGSGTVDGNRLYQLVRQQAGARERTFQIEFLDAGVQAFAFTFG